MRRREVMPVVVMTTAGNRVVLARRLRAAASRRRCSAPAACGRSSTRSSFLPAPFCHTDMPHETQAGQMLRHAQGKPSLSRPSSPSNLMLALCDSAFSSPIPQGGKATWEMSAGPVEPPFLGLSLGPPWACLLLRVEVIRRTTRRGWLGFSKENREADKRSKGVHAEVQGWEERRSPNEVLKLVEL